MRHFAVVNPHSFRAQEGFTRIMTELEDAFRSRPSDGCSIYISRYQRDAVSAVYKYLNEVPADETVRIYAVGGDGILFDCLNGMVRFKNAELTSVPYGRANDFVRAFGENAAVAFRDIKKLMTAPSRPVDIISYGANYALNEANIGIVGLSVIYSNAVLRKPTYKAGPYITSWVYTFGGLRALMSRDVIRQDYTILMDGEDISGKYANIHIANGACNGAYLVSSPYAVPDDGYFDVVLAHPRSRLSLASCIGNYTRGKFEKYKEIFRHTRCHELEVYSKQSLCVELDGESFYARDIKIKLVPGGVRFFSPDGICFADYSYRAHKGGAGL